ncbi:hypothetical protein ABZP36_029410 [Zizania latifolia]
MAEVAAVVPAPKEEPKALVTGGKATAISTRVAINLLSFGICRFLNSGLIPNIPSFCFVGMQLIVCQSRVFRHKPLFLQKQQEAGHIVLLLIRYPSESVMRI